MRKLLFSTILLFYFINFLQAQYLPTAGGTMTGSLNMSSGTQIQSPYYGFVYGAPQPSTSNNVAIFANSTSVTMDQVGWSNGWRFIPGSSSSYPAPVVTFSPAGAVAIGSTTSGLPAGGSALTLRGPNSPANSYSYQDINYSFVSAGSARIRAYRGGSWGTYLQFLVNNEYQGSDAPTVAMHIDATGSVGIGTTSPNTATKLDVSGSAIVGSGSVNPNTTKLFMRNPAGKTWAISSGLNLVNETDFGIYNWTDNQSNALFKISAGGNVGIGTNNPQSLLAVKGTVTAQRVVVTQSGWSDYVFDSSYKLIPLSSVESFIQTNKHLPDVPSTKNIESEGNDLADNQRILLQKIEELTLYIIEQNKQLSNQNMQIKTLQQQVITLQKVQTRTTQK